MITGSLLLPLRSPDTDLLAPLPPAHGFSPVVHGVSQVEDDHHKVDDGDTSESTAS